MVQKIPTIFLRFVGYFIKDDISNSPVVFDLACKNVRNLSLANDDHNNSIWSTALILTDPTFMTSYLVMDKLPLGRQRNGTPTTITWDNRSVSNTSFVSYVLALVFIGLLNILYFTKRIANAFEFHSSLSGLVYKELLSLNIHKILRRILTKK